jgi:hypothetical protein
VSLPQASPYFQMRPTNSEKIEGGFSGPKSRNAETNSVGNLAFQVEVHEFAPEVLPSTPTSWDSIVGRFFPHHICVRGYPTPRRRNPSNGLELSYSVFLRVLGGKSELVSNTKTICMNGANIGVELVGQEDDICYWHEAHTGQRPWCAGHSFPETSGTCCPPDLENMRHVLLECGMVDRPHQEGE